MIDKIGINLGEFQLHISTLKSSATGIDSSIETNRTFNQTNITPFTKDLEHIIKAIELINKYQTLLHSDIDTLNQTGKKIKETDERLATGLRITTGPHSL